LRVPLFLAPPQPRLTGIRPPPCIVSIWASAVPDRWLVRFSAVI